MASKKRTLAPGSGIGANPSSKPSTSNATVKGSLHSSSQAHKNRLKGLDDRADYVRYHSDGYTKDTKGLGYRSSNFTDSKKKAEVEASGKKVNYDGPKGPWVKTGRGPKLGFTKKK